MADNQDNLARSFDIIGESIDRMWLTWQASLGSFSGMQEQLENMTRNQLNQNKSAREEWIKMVEELGKQTRRNQEQFQQMVQDAIRNSYQYFNLSK
jgi:F0F1-type ATP synthase membrane subunit b/b'